MGTVLSMMERTELSDFHRDRIQGVCQDGVRGKLL